MLDSTPSPVMTTRWLAGSSRKPLLQHVVDARHVDHPLDFWLRNGHLEGKLERRQDLDGSHRVGVVFLHEQTDIGHLAWLYLEDLADDLLHLLPCLVSDDGHDTPPWRRGNLRRWPGDRGGCQSWVTAAGCRACVTAGRRA